MAAPITNAMQFEGQLPVEKTIEDMVKTMAWCADCVFVATVTVNEFLKNARELRQIDQARPDLPLDYFSPSGAVGYDREMWAADVQEQNPEYRLRKSMNFLRVANGVDRKIIGRLSVAYGRIIGAAGEFGVFRGANVALGFCTYVADTADVANAADVADVVNAANAADMAYVRPFAERAEAANRLAMLISSRFSRAKEHVERAHLIANSLLTLTPILEDWVENVTRCKAAAEMIIFANMIDLRPAVKPEERRERGKFTRFERAIVRNALAGAPLTVNGIVPGENGEFRAVCAATEDFLFPSIQDGEYFISTVVERHFAADAMFSFRKEFAHCLIINTRTIPRAFVLERAMSDF